MKSILILTYKGDDCANMVVNRLKQMGIEHTRFNTEEFQKIIRCTLRLSSDGKFCGSYDFPERNLDFSDIGVVWNRRIHDPEPSFEFDEPELKEWMLDESKWGFLASISLIKAPIVNPLEINERLKFNKWIQMSRATELGLDVPESCLTNQLEDIRNFWEKVGHEMIFKKIRKGFFLLKDGRRLLFHASKVPPDRFNNVDLQRMRFCPMFLQKHISKKYDVRSVVIGNKVFSFAIHSQDIPEGKVDYRKAGILGKMDEMHHEEIKLGPDIDGKLIAFTKSFGLTFSVIDLIITPDDRIVFFEDNPNGQWAWLEMKTGVPISQVFAECLIELSKKEGGDIK